MNQRPSVTGRALLALALMVGFYLLAIAISVLLFWIPYAEFKWAHRIDLRLAAFCVVGGGVILWSIIPRPDRFEPPGPALERPSQPRLFAVLDGVASALRQAMPSEVYLLRDLNAWVAQRGGIMGVGSRRIMGLGLPLLQALSVSELRAVLAHEFGHYDAGDTRLGPWVYKTRAAIVRTLEGLAHHSSRVLQAPFVWYGNMFLRTTHAVSRRQEFNADYVASSVAGSGPLIEGLRKIHGAAPALEAYWESEMVPVLSAGFRPPIAAGFHRFITSQDIARQIAAGVEAELHRSERNPYDTHPPLRERIEAVKDLPAGEPAREDPSAITLIDGVDALEEQLLANMVGEDEAGKLKSLPWEEVGRRAYRPAWQEAVQRNAAALAGIAAGAPERITSAISSINQRLTAGSTEDRVNHARWVLGAALALALADKGWTIRALPGEPILLESGNMAFDPFTAVRGLAQGLISAEEWRQRCTALRIAELRLAEKDGVQYPIKT